MGESPNFWIGWHRWILMPGASLQPIQSILFWKFSTFILGSHFLLPQIYDSTDWLTARPRPLGTCCHRKPRGVPRDWRPQRSRKWRTDTVLASDTRSQSRGSRSPSEQRSSVGPRWDRRPTGSRRHRKVPQRRFCRPLNRVPLWKWRQALDKVSNNCQPILYNFSASYSYSRLCLSRGSVKFGDGFIMLHMHSEIYFWLSWAQQLISKSYGMYKNLGKPWHPSTQS